MKISFSLLKTLIYSKQSKFIYIYNNILFLPEHLIHINIPNVIEAHLGILLSQSAQY